METRTKVLIALASILFPAGFVFAEDNSQPSPPGFPPGVREYHLPPHGDWNDASSTNSHATGTPYTRGEKKGLLKHFGTTTPPGIGHYATSAGEEASSSGEHAKNGLHLGLPFFLQWLFGLPTTTTIGEIRGELGSTTASTTPPHGLGGFFSNFFGGLGRFFGGSH